MPLTQEPDDDATLQELEELLCAIAAGGPLNRGEATTYSNCRSRLLSSQFRSVLPGFLHQCISLLRFKDFITLYDPDVDQRDRFVRRAFDPTRSLLDTTSRHEPSRRRDPEPQQWML